MCALNYKNIMIINQTLTENKMDSYASPAYESLM